MRLFPRLLLGTAGTLASELAGLTVEEAAARVDVSHADTVFGPTGGQRMTEGELRHLRTEVLEAAQTLGYPELQPRGTHGTWDAESSRILYADMGINAAEASQAGVWAFLSCVLLPDIVRWRFPGDKGNTTHERFLGAQRGIRNTFGRLWWRRRLLGDLGPDATDIVAQLTEDQLVQITERPVFASNAELAKAFAGQFLRCCDAEVDLKSDSLMRDAIKRMRRLLAFTALETVPVAEYDELAFAVLYQSVTALRGNTTALDELRDERDQVREPEKQPPTEPDSHDLGAETGLSPEVASEEAVRYRLREAILADGVEDQTIVRMFLIDGAAAVEWSGPQPPLRAGTADRIMRVIAQIQAEFLAQGPRRMRPLTAGQVADEIGVHESSISRLARGLRVATPWGMHDLKYFFPSAIYTDDGEVSATYVHELIKEMIENEDPEQPLTDERITAQLVDIGLHIARRTIAKYREQLGLGTAMLRIRSSSPDCSIGTAAEGCPPDGEVRDRVSGPHTDSSGQDGVLEQRIKDVIEANHPSQLSTREIVLELRQHRGLPRPTKTEVNSVLYSAMETWVGCTDATPPRWRLRDS